MSKGEGHSPSPLDPLRWGAAFGGTQGSSAAKPPAGQLRGHHPRTPEARRVWPFACPLALLPTV